MKLYRGTEEYDRVVALASKAVNTADKVVDTVREMNLCKDKVGKMSASAKVGLLVGGTLALCLLPRRVAYDSETGEGEYQSLLLHVKRKRMRSATTETAKSGKEHDVSWELFPTVQAKGAGIAHVKPCDLPPARTVQVVRATPMQVNKVQKARVCVPVKLRAVPASEEKI